MLYETTLTREAIDRNRAAGWWPDRLLTDDVALAVARYPQRIALVDSRGRLTYGELQERADQCALALLALGVRHGDVVAAQLPNWNEFVVLTLALERIGAVINPIAPIFRQRELRVLLQLAQPVAVVVPANFRGWDYPAMYRELQRELPALRHLIVVDDDADGQDGVLSWPQLMETGAAQLRHRSALDWLRPSPDDVTELMFTSGTTGQPKGVMHTANTLTAQLQAIVRGQQLTADEVFHMASTVGHQTGYLCGVRLPLHLGARAVYQEVWDAAEFIRLVDTEGVTFTMAATPFLSDVLRAPNLTGHAARSLRIFMCGGAPIPQSLAEEAVGRLGCRLLPAWGMTETGAVTTVAPDDPVARSVMTDGRAYPGMDLSVRDAEERICPAGQEGDLYVRGAFLFAGYVQGRHFTEEYFTPDGWFTTGDRAVMDPAGYIRITGRSKDIIIRGGENVPVKEVEDTLLRHPKVRGVALVGLPHAHLGELGCACVVPEADETLTLEEMRAFLAQQQMTRQFWPEQLELMEAFPTTPSGKVQKFLLREFLTARQSSAVPVQRVR